jgi:hypothetical protein
MELDCYLKNITQGTPGLSADPSSDVIETGMRRAQKMLDAAKAIKAMSARADRLARRVDAFEASREKACVKPPDEPEPLAATS